MDAQQEIFSELKIRLEAKGYDVYDGKLPPENTPYPFIYLGTNQTLDTMTKDGAGMQGQMGSNFQTVHVWHNNYRERGVVSSILSDVKLTAHELDKTDHHNVFVGSYTQRIIDDHTTNEPLMHGVCDIEFRFG